MESSEDGQAVTSQGPGGQGCTGEPLAKVQSSQLGAQEQDGASVGHVNSGGKETGKRKNEACQCGLAAFGVYGGHTDSCPNDVIDNNNNSHGSAVLPACQCVVYLFSSSPGRYYEAHSPEKETRAVPLLSWGHRPIKWRKQDPNKLPGSEAIAVNTLIFQGNFSDLPTLGSRWPDSILSLAIALAREA